MAQKRVYLDHNASTPLLPEARAAIAGTLDMTGNPSSVHAEGRALRARIEDARAAIARLAGAEKKQVVFTGSATEALTQAIAGGAKALGFDEIIVSAGEHMASLKAAEATGQPVRTLGLTVGGVIDIGVVAAEVARLESEGKLALFAVHAVNNETGVIQPVAEIERLVGPTRHFLLVDAVQAFGKLPLGFASRAADMMAISAHKMGGPRGVGALLMKSHCDAAKLIPGGGQETGRRGGTEAVALIAGFGAAAMHVETAYRDDQIRGMAERLVDGLKCIAPDMVVFGSDAERLGNVVCFGVEGIDAATALMSLDLAGIAVSSGSACSSGKVGQSHVLRAMKVPEQLASCALRVSLGWNSQAEEIEAFLEKFAGIAEKQRRGKGRAA